MLPFLLLNMHKIDAAMVEIWDDEVLDLDSDVLGPDRVHNAISELFECTDPAVSAGTLVLLFPRNRQLRARKR